MYFVSDYYSYVIDSLGNVKGINEFKYKTLTNVSKTNKNIGT